MKDKATQQRRILEYQEFDLRKFKVTDEGVDVTHFESGKDGGMIQKTGTAQPHPDLIESLDKLKEFMARRMGLVSGWNFAREAAKKNPELLRAALEGWEDAVHRCNVNGFNFVGSGEHEGVQITGSIKLETNGSVGLAAGKITFGKTDLGYENTVEDICEEIKREVYAYRFQGKKLQLDLETEIEKEEHPDLFKFPGGNPNLN